MDWLQKDIHSICMREWLRGFKNYTNHKFMLRSYSIQLHAACSCYNRSGTRNALNKMLSDECKQNNILLLLVMKCISFSLIVPTYNNKYWNAPWRLDVIFRRMTLRCEIMSIIILKYERLNHLTLKMSTRATDAKYKS